ncbi:unnamed protein product [Trichogramma brassicae]|uniref:Uncharacterized protein n=1 Tax=Trichogramma brassicae TaxID=86971 RepID=A0A6H5HTU5_9HYME|nr:unnamed protein product [Trichogramma brassicae]
MKPVIIGHDHIRNRDVPSCGPLKKPEGAAKERQPAIGGEGQGHCETKQANATSRQGTFTASRRVAKATPETCSTRARGLPGPRGRGYLDTAHHSRQTQGRPCSNEEAAKLTCSPEKGRDLNRHAIAAKLCKDAFVQVTFVVHKNEFLRHVDANDSKRELSELKDRVHYRNATKHQKQSRTSSINPTERESDHGRRTMTRCAEHTAVENRDLQTPRESHSENTGGDDV